MSLFPDKKLEKRMPVSGKRWRQYQLNINLRKKTYQLHKDARTNTLLAHQMISVCFFQKLIMTHVTSAFGIYHRTKVYRLKSFMPPK